ncbi:MAG: SpoIIE family protein phosphatase, partial [Candidatus Omnitrophica bacterium]|nr:SpoIIE family protein phosphatase [Candidatus Omnitrophota bacterium]
SREKDAELAAARIERALSGAESPESVLKEISGVFGKSAQLEIVWADGKRLSVPQEKAPGDADPRESLWYQDVARTKGRVPPRLDAGFRGEEAALRLSVPIFDANRWILKGVLSARIGAENLVEAVGKVFVREVQEVVWLMSPDGGVGLGIRAADVPPGDFLQIIDRCAKGVIDGGGVEFVGKEPYLVSVQTLPESGGQVLYPVSLRNLIGPILTDALVGFILAVAGVWVIANIGWGIIGGFVRRIERLSQAAEGLAAGRFDVRVEDSGKDEIGRLAATFNHMAESLRIYMRELEITTREKEAIATELQIAASLQEKALPKTMPRIPGLEVAARSFPAKSVGGDYFDFVYPKKGAVGFVIADAAGKGMPGSLFMSHSRSVFRVISAEDPSPSAMLGRINDFLAEDTGDTDGMFITYVFGLYDAPKQTLTYANAGHFPPLLLSSETGRFSELGAGGLPAGIMAGQTYTEEVVPFKSGDVLVMYTDGIIEAMNTGGAMFGVDRLMNLILARKRESAKQILDGMEAEVRLFSGEAPQHDDMTILVVKCL